MTILRKTYLAKPDCYESGNPLKDLLFDELVRKIIPEMKLGADS